MPIKKQIIFKSTSISVIALLIAVVFYSHASGATAQIITDKKNYNYGEPVKVSFAGAAGLDSDWICIAPKGSPDTEAGDYKYMPKGQTQGVFTFDSPSPGEYEVRAYYDYSKKGYAVTSRYAFTVATNPHYEKVVAEKLARMERKINLSNPSEAKIPPDKGLVYIVREPHDFSDNASIQIKANGKPIVVLPTNFFLYASLPGDTAFTIGDVITRDFKSGESEKSWNPFTGEVKFTIKPGYVYYLEVRLASPFAVPQLFQIEHQEGADLIKKYNLKQLK